MGSFRKLKLVGTEKLIRAPSRIETNLLHVCNPTLAATATAFFALWLHHAEKVLCYSVTELDKWVSFLELPFRM